MGDMMDEMEEFEKSVLGNAPIAKTEVPTIEEPIKEAWETMPLKELRKYYKTQIAERRAKEAEYIQQREKCKKIREFMKKVFK